MPFISWLQWSWKCKECPWHYHISLILILSYASDVTGDNWVGVVQIRPVISCHIPVGCVLEVSKVKNCIYLPIVLCDSKNCL
jgi:hypothetical protein